MICVDTSGFYAFICRDDQDHLPVTAAFRSSLEAGEAFVACSHVLVESMGLIQRRLGLRVLARFVADVLPLVQIRWLGAEEHRAAWALVERQRKRSFTIVDAASAVLMQQEGLRRIIALDPEFSRLGFDVLPV